MYAPSRDQASALAETRAPLLGLTSLFAALYFIQGVGDPTSGLIAQPVRSLLERWGESPAAIATFMALLALPWAVKPLLALLADFVPLFGSRRRNYLLVATASAAAGLGVAYLMPAAAGERWVLLVLLVVPTLGIAFADVLADALMIEVGKPRGLTGRLQSAQWFAAYLALLASGIVGGWLTASDRHDVAFLICAALWAGSLVLTLAFVREPRRAEGAPQRSASTASLRRAFAVPGLTTIAILSFVWDFNPLSYSVHYLHVTRALGLSEQAFGNAYALFSAGAMAATASYAIYCRRADTRVLLHVAIAAGILGNLLYWWVAGTASLYVVSLLVGFAYLTGSLILLDLAARLVPIPVAATVFAVIMALSSLGASIGEALGGYFYDWALRALDAHGAYRTTLLAGVTVTASCWLWTPRLLRELLIEAPRPDASPEDLASQ